jgi:hypothetical protein
MEILFFIYTFYVFAHFFRTQLWRKQEIGVITVQHFVTLKNPALFPQSVCKFLMILRERKRLLTIGIYNVGLARFL